MVESVSPRRSFDATADEPHWIRDSDVNHMEFHPAGWLSGRATSAPPLYIRYCAPVAPALGASPAYSRHILARLTSQVAAIAPSIELDRVVPQADAPGVRR